MILTSGTGWKSVENGSSTSDRKIVKVSRRQNPKIFRSGILASMISPEFPGTDCFLGVLSYLGSIQGE